MIDTTKVNETREKVKEALCELRKQGFIVRMNYLCCGNCAGYAIANKTEKLSKSKRSKVKGAIFWTKQDDTAFYQTGELFIYYGDIDTTKHGLIGLSTVDIGRIIVKKLKEKGLKVIWNEDPSNRIKITVNK